nr:hypothetical protein [Eubacterium sp.]
VLSPVFAGVYLKLHFGDDFTVNPTYNSVFAILFAWSACLAILGGGYRFLNFENPLTRFMTKRSFGLYIFHFLPISLGAYLLRTRTALGAPACYLIVLITAFAAGLLLTEAVSRIPVLRWLILGIKKQKPTKEKQ